MTKQIANGDSLSISNPIKLDTIWVCASWHHILHKQHIT
jgi:hypothetical protein